MSESLEQQFSDSVRQNLAVFSKGLNKLLNRTGIRMVSEVRNLQDENNNYATRTLSNLTNYKIVGSSITFGSNAMKNGVNYGLVQEFGKEPGESPNPDDLMSWVRKKVSLGHIKLSPSLGKTFEARVESLAFIIGRKIKEKGIKGKFFYRQAFQIGNEFFLSRIDNLITESFS